MIYVEFYKNKPFLISDISESEFEEYKKHADIREFESLEVFLLDYPDFESEKKSIDKLPQLRREAIKKADEQAAEIQRMIVGTPDKNRETRFKLNAEAAYRYTKERASDAQTAMLQMQLDANVANNHPIVSSMTLMEFAEWMLGLGDIGFIGNGIVESVYITCVCEIEKATTQAEIDEALSDMNASFYIKLNQTMSG